MIIIEKSDGIILTDAIIAIIILMIFLSIISTVSYSIYIAANFTKRNSKATDYGVKIIEYIDKTPYNDIDTNIIQYINSLDDKIQAKFSGDSSILNSPYKAIITIEKYKDMPGNSEKKDVIKNIKIEITYTLRNKEEKVTFERIKTL